MKEAQALYAYSPEEKNKKGAKRESRAETISGGFATRRFSLPATPHSHSVVVYVQWWWLLCKSRRRGFSCGRANLPDEPATFRAAFLRYEATEGVVLYIYIYTHREE